MSTRRSARLEMKNIEAAFASGSLWYDAARAVWESDPKNPYPRMPAAVRRLEVAYEAALARCSAPGKIVVLCYLFDQPLPAGLEEQRETLSIAQILEEIWACSTSVRCP